MKFFLIISFLPLIYSFNSCQKTILLTNTNIENNINHHNNNSEIKHFSTSMINLKSMNQQFCFTNSEENITFSIKILEEKDICTNFDLLYYIPKNLDILCDSKSNLNFFNNYGNPCKNNDFNLFETFPNLNQNNEGIITKGCILEHGFSVNTAYWWYSKLFNKHNSLDSNAYYTVYSCSSSYTALKLEFNILKGFKQQKVIIDLTNLQSVMTPLENFNLTMSFISSNENSINILNKCFLTDSDNNTAIIDACNFKDATILGEIGEIQCSTPEDSITLTNCIHGYNLQSFLINDKIVCPLTHISSPSIFNHHKLPKSFSGYSVEYDHDSNINSISSIKFIKNIQNIILGFQSSFIPKQTITEGICIIDPVNKPIMVKGISDYYSGSFSLIIKSSSKFIVSFKCDISLIPIQELLTDISLEFKPYIFHLNPGLSNFNTICNVSCNNFHQFSFNLIGSFTPKNVTLIPNKFKNKYFQSNINNDDSFSNIFNYLSEPFQNLKSIIINFIIYIIIFLLILIFITKFLPSIIAYLFKSTSCNKSTLIQQDVENIPLHYSLPPPPYFPANNSSSFINSDSNNTFHPVINKSYHIISFTNFISTNITFHNKFSIKNNNIYFKNSIIISNISFIIILNKNINIINDNNYYKIQEKINNTTQTIIKYSKTNLNNLHISSHYFHLENYIFSKNTHKHILYIPTFFNNPTTLNNTSIFYIHNHSLYSHHTKKPQITNIFFS